MPIEKSDLDALRQRLQGELLAAGDPGWEEARFGWNVGYDPRPELIALPRGAEDVAAIVRFAAGTGLRVAPQNTAHNPGPLGPLEGAILVRTAGMDSVEVDSASRTARVGAGARWGDLVPQASELGLAALHGSSPTVGIVGYSLGGGLGWYARKHGLACNRVTGLEVVTADGERRRVDRESEPDLFWALRGGGGSYAFVTAIEFELLELPQLHAGALFFPFERGAEVLHAWHEWSATVPEEMTSIGRLLRFPPLEQIPEPVRGKSFAIVETVFIGSEAEGAELTAPLAALGPVMNSLAAVPPAGISGLHMDPPGPIKGMTGHSMLELSPEAIDVVVETAGSPVGAALNGVELRHCGGALSREAEGCGALPNLPGTHLMSAVTATMEPAEVEPAEAAQAALAAAIEPHTAGRTLNFCSGATPFEDCLPAATCERLRATKAGYDPEGRFQANHELDR
ncbi:MAG TPA: FAD-binding oxidoreductase [Solirubrobacterales bacterium]